MEKVPLHDILESIRQELENLKSTEGETAVYADVAIAGIGSTMNLIRCGTRDGHLSTCAFNGEEIKILVRVIASRKKTQPGRSGRGARKTQQQPALPPPTAN